MFHASINFLSATGAEHRIQEVVPLPPPGRLSLTPAVVQVAVGGAIVLAQPLQDELVVHEALDGLEQEGVERQVADLLQLKLLVDRLQLLQPLGGLLQLRQHLVVLLQEAGELLAEPKTTHPASGRKTSPGNRSNEPSLTLTLTRSARRAGSP